MKNAKWKWLGIFTAVMLICGISVGATADTRVSWEGNAADYTGIYINEINLDDCSNKLQNSCDCDPACTWTINRCVPKTAGTLRIYGEDGLDAAFPYDNPTGPFDLESPEAPEKDFLIWNPAIMPDSGTGSTEFYRRAIAVNGNDAREKVFLRQWYVPRYLEPRGTTWNDAQPQIPSADIVKEYTFMLLDTDNQPYPGSAGSTSFVFPTAYNNNRTRDNQQIGLESWDVDGDGKDDPTLLNEVGFNYIDIGTGQLRLQSNSEDGDFPTDIEFLDHRAEITFVGSSITESWALVKIYYPSAFLADGPIGASEFVMEIGETLVAGRHEVNVSATAEPTPVLQPWYLKLIAVDITTEPFTAIVKVGRLLQEGESFFSDGAEYDVAKIETEGDDLLYITLRNPLPKLSDVALDVLTVVKAQVKKDEPFPMLPPFNKEHAVVDDINISCGSISSRIVPGVCPVVERWVLETGEPRFATRLCEILDDLNLNWGFLPVNTLPNRYTELLLPPQPDARGSDYLLVSSFKAPNSAYARVAFDYDPDSNGLTDVYNNPSGLRVYGEDSKDAAFPYDDQDGPFNPASSEAPEKDFITFNPAIMPDAGTGSTQFYREALFVNGNDANEKVFLRQWYVPDYPEPKGNVWTNQETVYTADIVKEYTFMLLDPSNQPYPGSAGSTSFIFPTAYSNQDQIGLDGWDVDGDGEDDPTLLNEVRANYIDIGTGQHRLQGIDTDPDNFPSDIEFLDHKAEIDFVGSSQGVSWINVTIYYPSAFGDNDQIGASEFVMAPGDKLLAGRHIVELGDNPEPVMMPWYLELIAVDIYTHPYTAIVKVGRLLQEGESFFSDGAEYDVAKIQTEGNDLLYITLRNPLPKCEVGIGDCRSCEDPDCDVDLTALTVVKECVCGGEPIPMLPPFNKIHAVIDDVGDNFCSMRTIYPVDQVIEYWNDQTTEPRFSTNLCEIYNGSGWGDETFRTKPDAYTEFVLPAGTNDVKDYLFTSSWVLQDAGSEPPPPPMTYCVSGTVTDVEDIPLPGIQVTADGVSDFTGPNGGYEICELEAGIYTFSPNSEAYTFEPESQNVPISSSDVTDVDFTGNSTGNGGETYSISGTISDGDANPLPGITVVVTLQIGDGNPVAGGKTGSDGTYVIGNVAAGGDYRVTPGANLCDFEPTFTAINNLDADRTSVNFVGVCIDNPSPDPVDDPIVDDPIVDDPIVDDPIVDDPEAPLISVEDAFLIRSRWFILPSFLTIKGNNTSFDASTKVTFEPRNAVIKLLQRVVDEESIATFVLVMPSWLALADGQELALKVTTGPEEAGSAVDIKMLSTVLASE